MACLHSPEIPYLDFVKSGLSVCVCLGWEGVGERGEWTHCYFRGPAMVPKTEMNPDTAVLKTC